MPSHSLLCKQIVHCYYMDEVTTVFVMFKTVCGDQGTVDGYLSWNLF